MEAFRREIFEQLGNLFYAVAIEQHMSLISSGELKMAVRKNWLGASNGYDSQSKVSEAAHLIAVTIDALQADGTPSSEAFSAFEKFFRQHEEQFSYALKQQILETADTIMNTLPSDGTRNVCYDSLKGLFNSTLHPDTGREVIAPPK